MKHKKWLKELAEDVYNGIGDCDHPECPECGSKMKFYGGDRAYGDGYWECSSCGYSFTENDLPEIDYD